MTKGWIRESQDGSESTRGSARARIVYELTADGKERFQTMADKAGPASWGDEEFAAHFSFLSRTPAGRRARLPAGPPSRARGRPATPPQAPGAPPRRRGPPAPLMSTRQRAGLRSFTALLCMMVILPVGTAASYSLIQRDVVGTMFSAPIGTNDSPELDVRPGKGPDPWAGVTRVNMLLLGSDAGDDRIGTRTDSMIVASMNPQTGETVLFSPPRNLQTVPLPKTNPPSTK